MYCDFLKLLSLGYYKSYLEMNRLYYLQLLLVGALLVSDYYVTAVSDNIPEDGDDDGYQADDGKSEQAVVPSGPPPKIISTSQDFSVHLGDTITLPCVVENINPNGVLMWSKVNGSSNPITLFVKTFNIAKIERYVFLNNTNALEIRNITSEDGGYYNCSFSSTPTVHVLHSITILSPASIVSLDPPNSGKFNVRKGESLNIYCNTAGVPKPVVQWRKLKNGADLYAYDLISKDGLLMLKSITENDAGQYVCWANNTENKTPAISDIITVAVAPSKSVGTVKIVAENATVYAGDSDIAELVCLVTGNKLKINWFKDDQKVINSGHYLITSENARNILTIAGIKPEDFGEYKCQVVSGVSSNETFWDVVKFYGAPQRPKIQTSTLQAGNPVLSWLVDSNAALTNYTITYVRTEDNLERVIKRSFNNSDNATTPFTISHTFENLPNGQYKAKLEVENRHGISKPSDEYIFAVDNGSSTSIPIKGAEVGGSGSEASQLRICVAILLAFIFPIVFC